MLCTSTSTKLHQTLLTAPISSLTARGQLFSSSEKKMNKNLQPGESCSVFFLNFSFEISHPPSLTTQLPPTRAHNRSTRDLKTPRILWIVSQPLHTYRRDPGRTPDTPPPSNPGGCLSKIPTLVKTHQQQFAYSHSTDAQVQLCQPLALWLAQLVSRF